LQEGSDDGLGCLLKYELRGSTSEPNQPTIYFDFDKATLTHMGQEVVKQVLAEARMFMPSAVAVIGYTDTAGGTDYNLALGLRRANRVRDALIAGGIPAGIITVATKGMSDPLLATGPNVKEASNRRVEIHMEP
jgi:OOP family OmpA-OmpF porin